MTMLDPMQYIAGRALYVRAIPLTPDQRNADPNQAQEIVYADPGAEPGSSYDPVKAHPLFGTGCFPHVVYQQIGALEEEALEGQFSLEWQFRIDCRSNHYGEAEAVRRILVESLRRGGRMARAGSILDLEEASLSIFTRVSDTAVVNDLGARRGLDPGEDGPNGRPAGEWQIYRRVQDVWIEM